MHSTTNSDHKRKHGEHAKHVRPAGKRIYNRRLRRMAERMLRDALTWPPGQDWTP